MLASGRGEGEGEVSFLRLFRTSLAANSSSIFYIFSIAHIPIADQPPLDLYLFGRRAREREQLQLRRYQPQLAACVRYGKHSAAAAAGGLGRAGGKDKRRFRTPAPATSSAVHHTHHGTQGSISPPAHDRTRRGTT